MNRLNAPAKAKTINVFLKIFVLSMKMPPPIMPNIPKKEDIPPPRAICCTLNPYGDTRGLIKLPKEK